MSFWKTASAACAMAGMLSCMALDYANPALNKVKFDKTPVHAPLELVKDGKLRFAIVCDLSKEQSATIAGTNRKIGATRRSLLFASEYLKRYLRQSLGEEPRILKPDSPELEKYPLRILLGKSSLTDRLGIDIASMPPDGFKIMTYDSGIVIAGRDGSMIPGSYEWNDMGNYLQNGTINAVFDFLERILGMRFYYPGLGTIVPQYKNLTVHPVSYTDHPKYLTRAFGSPSNAFHNKGEKPHPVGLARSMEFPWEDIPNNQGDFFAAYRMQSRPTRWMCSEGPSPFKVAKAFPDRLETCFYREKNGRLRQSLTQYTANAYDLSNMEFSKLLAESFLKFYESKGKINLLWDPVFIPNPEYMYFGPVDSGCVIDNERVAHLPKRTEPHAVMSEVHGQFYYDLATRLKTMIPGKKIVFMAYANYVAAPLSVRKFPENTRIMVCSGTPVFIRDKASEEFWKKTYSDWNSRIAEKVVTYPYDPAYNPQGGISHALRGSFEGEYLRKMAPYISDFALFPCVYFNWGYYYSVYLISRAHWNPEFNAEAALEEHWPLLYGPAAPYLKEFYALALSRWTDHYIPNATINKGCIPGLDYKTLYQKAYPETVFRQMRDLLNKAQKAVAKGSAEERRLTFFRMPWVRIMNDAAARSNLKKAAPYRLKYADKAPQIDGILNEDVWKKANIVSFKSAYYGENKTQSKTSARLLWNRKGIYLGIFNPAPYRKVGKLWNDDNMEFFLSPGKNRNKLFQFVISSSGAFEDYFQSFDPPRDLEASWICKGLQKSVHADEKGWSMELFIPFSALDGETAPLPGDSWLANLISNRNDSETMSYSPTLGNNRNLNFYADFYFSGNWE